MTGIQVPQIEADEITLLIGSDVPEAFWVEEDRRGLRGEPYALKTPLGWSLLGPVSKDAGQDKEAQMNFQHAEYDAMLQEKLELMWKIDFPEATHKSKQEMSREDMQALKIMKTSVVNEDNRYKLSMPWRKDPALLPNNLALAQSRLNLLKRRFIKDENLHEAYAKSVQDYIDKGFARRVTPEEAKREHAWFIPHHAVINPNKPGKTRVVFDCSAKYKGVSLNDNLLNGPDMVKRLIGVLTRFRQEQVAIMADVEAMFHQVMVADEDCNYLRFLWWDGGDLTRNHFSIV